MRSSAGIHRLMLLIGEAMAATCSVEHNAPTHPTREEMTCRVCAWMYGSAACRLYALRHGE